MNYRFANGTNGTVVLPANGATVTTVGQGSSGIFNGTGWSWAGSPDLSYYKITLDSPESGLVGSFILKSEAAAHYPCGPAEAGQNMEVAPTIGWSNAVPDAVGDVDIEVLGSELKFTGVAYHDKVCYSFLQACTELTEISRIGQINHSSRMFKVGTGAMDALDLTHLSGSTQLAGMAKSMSAHMHTNMAKSLPQAVRQVH